MIRLRILRLFALAGLFLISGGVCLATDPVILSIKEKDHTFDVQGSFDVGAEAPVAWEVLTDFERLPRFVGGIKKSHVMENLGEGHLLVQQEFESGFLFITKRVHFLLDVHETMNQAIVFTDTGHKDFYFYDGSWVLSPNDDKGMHIVYTLKAKQNFDLPFAGDYFRGGVKDLLNSVRREIIRQQKLPRDQKAQVTINK